MKNKRTHHNAGVMRAKLTFDEGFAENPIYKVKAMTTEKDKGILMIDLIQQNFNISIEEFKKGLIRLNGDAMRPTIIPQEIEIKQTRIKWTRNDKGNIISPFKSRDWRNNGKRKNNEVVV